MAKNYYNDYSGRVLDIDYVVIPYAIRIVQRELRTKKTNTEAKEWT